MNCPLCSNTTNFFFNWQERNYDYYSCQYCHYIFLAPQNHLSPQKEREVYDLHENNPNDLAYRDFLSQLVVPLKNHIHPKEQFLKGLDFGCGPGPTLHLMLEDLGIKMDIFDPIYFPDFNLLGNSYDLITCSEVFEHFKDPIGDFTKLYNALRRGGILGVMTEFYHEGRDFPNWHYIKYHTHVGFFSKNSLSYLADRFHMEINFYNDRIAVFKKN